MSKVLFTVATVVPRFRSVDSVVHAGLMHYSSSLRGITRYSAVGGKALLLPETRPWLVRRYEAEFPSASLDAKFYIDEKYVPMLVNLFSRPSGLCNIDPRREVEEELAAMELVGQQRPVLSGQDVAQMDFCYVGWATKHSNGLPDELDSAPTVKLFHCWEAITSPLVIEKLRRAREMHVLSRDEEDSLVTNGRAYTPEGKIIGDNIFVANSQVQSLEGHA